MNEMINFQKCFFFAIIFFFSAIILALADGYFYYPQFLIEVLCVGLLFKYIKRFNRVDILLFAMLFFCLLQKIVNPTTFRFSTIAYTFLFSSVFIVYHHILEDSRISIEKFIKIIKFILIIQAFVLFVQQIQSLFGMVVFNLKTDFSSAFKLNALSWESSNLALIASAHFFAFIKCREIQLQKKYDFRLNFKEDYLVWILFLYLSLLCGSMSGFISVAFVMLYFVTKKNVKYVVALVILFFACLPLFSLFNIFKLERLETFFAALISGNPDVMIQVDASAACRIIPYYNFINSINPFDVHFWLGYGIDVAENNAKNMILVNQADRSIGATNITAFFYDYGIIAGALFLFFLKRSIVPKWLSYEMFLYTFVFSVMTINHHVLWIFLMNMATIRHFVKRNALDSQNQVFKGE